MWFVLKDLAEGEEIAIDHRYDPGELEVEYDDFHYDGDLHFVGKACKGEKVLTVTGELTSAIEQTCCRCLERARRTWREPVHLVYETAGKKEIDSTQEVREIMIFAHPQRFVCAESCKSLCPMCGQNLNRGSCSCRPPASESPFGGLKGIA